MRLGFGVLLLACALVGCSRSPTEGSGAAAVAARTAEGFPMPDRPVASHTSADWSTPPDRDAADESGQLIRGLRIRSGMTVADIGAGSGYHTLRLSPAVGPKGLVYAEDIVESYVSGLRREAERRGMKNIRIVVGAPDDPKLPADSIDRAVLVHKYHEIENPYALLWRLAPSLKPGALVGVIDIDQPTSLHGTPPELLTCEFEAVGYRAVSQANLEGGVGYLAVFEAPPRGKRPKPSEIKACKAPA
jgi:predicted O-methyltransferase YrrM